MVSDYGQIVSGEQNDNWRSFKIDRTYSRQGESFNAVNCKGIVFYYTATKTTDQSVTVSIAYVFFLGVGSTPYSMKTITDLCKQTYYETLNHAALVRKDLISDLCDNLVKDMNNVGQHNR